MGTWGSLAEELGVGPGRSRIVEGEAILQDADGNLVWAGQRPVALVGVEGIAVIDAEDALLVTRLDRSGEVRRVTERLQALGRTDLT